MMYIPLLRRVAARLKSTKLIAAARREKTDMERENWHWMAELSVRIASTDWHANDRIILWEAKGCETKLIHERAPVRVTVHSLLYEKDRPGKNDTSSVKLVSYKRLPYFWSSMIPPCPLWSTCRFRNTRFNAAGAKVKCSLHLASNCAPLPSSPGGKLMSNSKRSFATVVRKFSMASGRPMHP